MECCSILNSSQTHAKRSFVNSLPLSESNISGQPWTNTKSLYMAFATVVASLSGMAFAIGHPCEMICHHKNIFVTTM